MFAGTAASFVVRESYWLRSPASAASARRRRRSCLFEGSSVATCSVAAGFQISGSSTGPSLFAGSPSAVEPTAASAARCWKYCLIAVATASC